MTSSSDCPILHHTPQGHIHIGTTTSIAMQILPRVLSYFQDQFPLIKTTIHSMTSSQIMTPWRIVKLILALRICSKKIQALETSVLYYDTFELIVSTHHPLSRFAHLSIEKLRNIPFIMLSPETAGRRFVDQIFKTYEVSPHIVMELSSSEEVKRMVELNLGVAIISKLSVADELRHGTLKMVRVNELDITHPVGVVYKSGRYLNSAMQQFLRDLKGMPETQFIGSE